MLPQFSTTAAAQRQEEGRLRRLEDKALRAAMRESAKYAPTPSSPPVASPPTKTKLYLILLVWISIYSGWNIIGRNVSQEGPVLRLLILNCLRALVASIITLILMVCMQEPWPDLNPKDTVKWLALGIVTCVMNNVYTLGLRWTTATNVATTAATTPSIIIAAAGHASLPPPTGCGSVTARLQLSERPPGVLLPCDGRRRSETSRTSWLPHS